MVSSFDIARINVFDKLVNRLNIQSINHVIKKNNNVFGNIQSFFNFFTYFVRDHFYLIHIITLFIR